MEEEDGRGRWRGGDEWECESQLGSGGFGIVHVWRHRVTGQRFALKKCKFGSDISLTQKHKAAWGKEVDSARVIS